MEFRLQPLGFMEFLSKQQPSGSYENKNLYNIQYFYPKH